ncbi:MAG: hypothetical protein IPL23_17330 [Saprospiraceae bacterium]|nr:hypothetical protein [Saprospiraceae bacterium]
MQKITYDEKLELNNSVDFNNLIGNDKDFYKPENVGLPSHHSKGYVYLSSGLIAIVLIIAH